MLFGNFLFRHSNVRVLVIVICVPLSGCVNTTSNYYCVPADNGSRAICISNIDMDFIQQHRYSDSKFDNFINFVLSDSAGQKRCMWKNNSLLGLEDNVMFRYYEYYDGTKISTSTPAYVCRERTVNAYEQKLQDKEKEKKAEIRKKEDAEQRRREHMVAEQHPEVRKKIYNQFYDRCANNLKNNRVQFNPNYIQQMCDCFACVFDGIHGDEAVYEYVQSNGRKQTVSDSWYPNIIYGMWEQCDVSGRVPGSFQPCKWAQGKNPF
ncbi:MAG: hypothetical protein J6Y49_02015 [Alphaproteobacteria bacterium]|nr:hypothetical protein [Alphaproteobacteria bacterium]